MAGPTYFQMPEVEITGDPTVPPDPGVVSIPPIDIAPPTDQEIVQGGLADYGGRIAQQPPTTMPVEGAGEWAMPNPADLQAGQALAPPEEAEAPPPKPPPGSVVRNKTEKTVNIETRSGREISPEESANLDALDQRAEDARDREEALRKEQRLVYGNMDYKDFQFRDELAKVQSNRDKALKKAEQDMAEAAAATDSFKFQDFFSSRGAASGIATMLGMAAAGFLQGWSNGRVNMMPMFEKAIQQDFEKQKAEYQRLRNRGIDAKNAYGAIANKFDDEEQRRLQFYNSSMNQLNRQLIDIRGGLKDENSDMFALQAAKYRSELEKQKYGSEIRRVTTKEANDIRYKNAGLVGGGGPIPLTKYDQHSVDKYFDAVLRHDKGEEFLAARKTGILMRQYLSDPKIRQIFDRLQTKAWDENAVMAGMGAELLADKEMATKYKLLQQLRQQMVGITIHKRNGSAVTDSERANTMKELLGSGSYEEQMSALNQYFGLMRDWDDVAGGYLSDNAMAEVDRRLLRNQARQYSPVGTNPVHSEFGNKPTAGKQDLANPNPGGAPPKRPTVPVPDNLFGPPPKK